MKNNSKKIKDLIKKQKNEYNKIQKQIDSLIEEEKDMAEPFLIEVRKEGKELVKQAKKLFSKKEEFIINLPIKFIVNNIVDIQTPQDIYNNYGMDPIIIDIRGDIAAKASDLGLNNAQFSLLRNMVKDNIDDACEDIQILMPKELSNNYKQFEKKTIKYYKKVSNLAEKHGIINL